MKWEEEEEMNGEEKAKGIEREWEGESEAKGEGG